MKALITVSYSVWGHEEAEAGDTDRKGWEDEEGTEYTFREAVKLLRDKSVEPSSTSYHEGVWYSSTEEDWRTGDTKELSYHVKADSRFQRRLYQAVTKRMIGIFR